MRVIGLLLALAAAAVADEPVRLILLHTNDVHGQLRPLPPSPRRGFLRTKPAGGFAHLATMVRNIRKTAKASGAFTLLLDGGDIYQGTPIGNESRGKAVVDAMNALGYDAGALGNHEFDFGRKVLDALIDRATFPFLAANMSGHEKIKPYIVIDKPRAPCKIAIIGLITPATPYITTRTATKGLSFTDPIPVLRALRKEVVADLYVVVSHCGKDDEFKMARNVDGIAAIIGGHSHSPYVVNIEGTVAVQTHTRSLSLGRIDLELDPESFAVRSGAGRQLIVDPGAVPADPAITKIIEHYGKDLDKKLEEVVGTVTGPLRRDRRHRSCSAGNWMADVMRTSGKADIGFMNKGGVRAEIEAGDVTFGDVYRIMPFDNVVTAMDLTGAEVLALLTRHFATRGALDWSGLAVDVVPGKKGYRVAAVTVGGVALDPKKTYRVATNSFMAAGGDGYKTFRAGRNRFFGRLVREALADDLRARSPLTPPAEQRLRVLERAK
ncbi:MAG: bifunctional metallophosphatase/5'-nucleotidase [Planctomycetota bacterium]|nr:bifunctional metallophosphatase/5'-nucleotidase [Planctomycetota bacterium]